MSEFRGEALHICPRIILNYQKEKKLKTTIKMSKLIKMNDYTVLSVYIRELRWYLENNVSNPVCLWLLKLVFLSETSF